MKKFKTVKPDDMRAEYTRKDFPGGLVRGKYAARIAKGSNIVILTPEVAAAFPTAESVNKALSSLIRVKKKVTHSPAQPCGNRRNRSGASG